jgi:tetratricopeptide (TPR) repeat protein
VELLNNLGAYHLVAGNWGEAGRLLAEGLAEAQKLGTVQHQALFHLNLGILRTWQGDDAAAETHLQTLDRHVGEYASNAKYSLADLRLRQARFSEAAALLAEAEKLIGEAGTAYQQPELYRLQAQLALAQGEQAAAFTAVDKSIKLAQAMSMARDEGIAHGVLGQLLAARGDEAAAADAFRHSLALLNSEPYETARTQAAWGRMLLAGGDGAAGVKLIEAAEQTFVQLGAVRDLHATAKSVSGASIH